jgi:hypothetical protein
MVCRDLEDLLNIKPFLNGLVIEYRKRELMEMYGMKLKAKKGLLTCLAIMVITGVSCESPSQSVNSGFPSGGLGLTRNEWERTHGRAFKEDSAYVYYKDGRFKLNFMDANAGYLEWVYGDVDAVSIDEARNASKEFIPTDSTLIRTYQLDSGYMVDLYSSESLKNRFSGEDWIGGEPGNFIVMFKPNRNRVSSFIIGVGNNP